MRQPLRALGGLFGGKATAVTLARSSFSLSPFFPFYLYFSSLFFFFRIFLFTFLYFFIS
jgi:hypothetical protein